MILQPVCMKADIYCLKIVRITYFKRILSIVSHSDLYLQNLKGSPNSLVRRNGEGWLDLLSTFWDQSEYNSDMADVCFLKSGVAFKLHGRNLKKNEKLLWRLNIAGSDVILRYSAFQQAKWHLVLAQFWVVVELIGLAFTTEPRNDILTQISLRTTE